MKLKKEVTIVLAVIVVIVIGILFVSLFRQSKPKQEEGTVQPPITKPEVKPEEKPEVKPEEKPDEELEEEPENEGTATVANPESITMLVNKQRFMAPDFVPTLGTFPVDYAVSEGYEARPEVVDAYVLMVDTMEKETGLWMYVTSAYRGYDFQKELYDGYVSQHGEEEAKRMVAYPGSSEHQTGLVVDVVTPGGNMFTFGETEQSTWVNANAHRFGFVVRYEPQFEDITGYMAEAWHLRYLGVDVATEVYQSGRPFDEYHAKYLD